MSEVDKLAKCIRECLDIIEGFYGVPRTIKINPEPEPQPCAHEPKQVDHLIARPFSGITQVEVFIQECKHCGAKIKAEKWVEV